MASAAAARVVAGGVAPKINVAARDATAKSPTSRRASAVARALRPTAAFVDVVESEPGTLLKPFEEGMQKSLLFGVSHMMNNHEAAEYILNSKSRSVVVETGLCKAHQEKRGTVFNFAELFASIHMAGGAAEEALAFITRVAHQLRLEEQPLAGSPFWAQMKTQLPAEALVYAAAFAPRQCTANASARFGRSDVAPMDP